ncbi:MAG: ATP-binding protein [Gemmatimonadaceae bacterium]
MYVDKLARAVPVGLRRRLIFLVLHSVLPFLLLIGMVARRHLLDQKPLAAERALAKSREIANQVDARFRNIESVMRAVAYSLSGDPAESAANDKTLAALDRNLPFHIARWDLFTAGGQLIGSSSPESTGRQVRSDAEQPIGSPLNAFVTEPVATERDGLIVRMVLPMLDQRGTEALLVAQIPVQSFREVIAARDLPAGSSVALVSERGIIVGRSPDPDRWVGFDISKTPLDSLIRATPNGTAEFTTQDSVRRVIGITQMRKAPWIIGAGIPTTVVYAQARRNFARAMGWGGLALLLAFLLASWQATRIIEPLTRLSADAAKLGTGNLAHRSGVFARDEMGELATAMNEMATTLEQQGAVLRESEARYRGLFDINPLPMWVLDPTSLAFLAVNRAAVEAYGWSEEEFLAMKASEIRPEEGVPELLSRLSAVGEKGRRFVTRHKRKDGTVFEVEVDSGAIAFGGRPARLIVAHDVSERIRAEKALRDAEAQLRQSQRLEAIGQLTGGIAHDFNNVLTAIGSYSDFLYESLDAGDARRLDIQEIRKAANRAAGLTKQLLAFSRSQILQPRVIDVNASLMELESLLKRLLTADLELKFALDPEVGHVRADPGQMAQVVINLAVNARDAMPGGGVLTIASRNEQVRPPSASAPHALAVRPGEYVVLEISDTGSGMEPETLQRIFEPFFTTKGPGRGTGLGLSTVYGIVHQSGGYIFADSVVGSGTTFTIRLPRVDLPVEPDRPKAEKAIGGRRSETILVVEDEEAVRRAAKRILVKKGYTVLEAGAGHEALEVFTSHPGVDLLLTDLVMPVMGGRELVRVLRDQGRSVPTLFMSGYTKDAVMRAELDPDIMVLEKPFSQDELAAKVREVLDSHGE